MLAGELDRPLGVLRRADELEVAVARHDRLDQSTGEGVVVCDEQPEGHSASLVLDVQISRER